MAGMKTKVLASAFAFALALSVGVLSGREERVGRAVEVGLHAPVALDAGSYTYLWVNDYGGGGHALACYVSEDGGAVVCGRSPRQNTTGINRRRPLP